MAQISNIAAVLKTFYHNKVFTQLNNEIVALSTFRRASVKWNGDQAIFAVKVARNSGVDVIAEDDATPTAGYQGTAKLSLQAKYVVGSIRQSGPAIAANKGDGTLVAQKLSFEMEGIKDDIAAKENSQLFSGCGGYAATIGATPTLGGMIVGFVHERIAENGATHAWQFSGDHTKFIDILTGALAANCTVRLIRMDTYDYHKNTTVGNAIVDFPVTAISQGVLTLNHNVGAGGVRVDTTSADAAMGSWRAAGAGAMPIPYGIAFAVEISAGAFGGAATPALVTKRRKEITGIYSQLGSPLHFGNERNSYVADGTANATVQTALRSTVYTVYAGDVDASYVWTDLDLERLQAVFDAIKDASDKDPTVMWMNPLLRQKYTSLLVGVSGANLYKSTDSAKPGDGGFKPDQLGFNGVPIFTSKDCSKGLICFLHIPMWFFAELKSPGWEEEDGKILAKVSGALAYEGLYSHYVENLCAQPNAQGILTGVKFPGV